MVGAGDESSEFGTNGVIVIGSGVEVAGGATELVAPSPAAWSFTPPVGGDEAWALAFEVPPEPSIAVPDAPDDCEPVTTETGPDRCGGDAAVGAADEGEGLDGVATGGCVGVVLVGVGACVVGVPGVEGALAVDATVVDGTGGADVAVGCLVVDPPVLWGGFGTVDVVVGVPGVGAGPGALDPDVGLPALGDVGVGLGAAVGAVAVVAAKVNACPALSTTAQDPAALHDTARRWPKRSISMGADHVAPSKATSFPNSSTAVHDVAPGHETAVSCPRESIRVVEDHTEPL